MSLYLVTTLAGKLQNGKQQKDYEWYLEEAAMAYFDLITIPAFVYSKKNSVACSAQANYTDRATEACRRS
jgi:hypothetical protein